MTDARCFQAMVPMRDGIRLNTFVFLPESGGPRWPVILHRTPYGIAAADARDKTDCTRAWLPNPAEPMRGSILRGWQQIVAHGYAAVYQDTRGRHGSEGEDRVYADDAGGRPRHARMDRGPALDQPDGRHVRVVGRRHHHLRRGIDPPPQPARLLCPGGRLEHL